MDEDGRPAIRYQPKHCTFLGKVVWGIVTQQADGTWRVVNCLDKDDSCFGLNCAFTTDHGDWPYKDSPAEQPQSQE